MPEIHEGEKSTCLSSYEPTWTTSHKFQSKHELVTCIKDVLLGNPGFVHEILKTNVQFSPKEDSTETQGSSLRCQSLQHFNI